MNNIRAFLTVPVAILIAGVIIAGAIIYGLGYRSAPSGGDGGQVEDIVQGDASKIRPISDDDHILGDKDAPIKIVEFSDMECPFCGRFHPTMQQVVKDYDGQVAWAYRHFPLDSIHPNARPWALASECAAELGGNDGFWKFIDYVFANQDSITDIVKVAGDQGLDKTKFKACVDSKKYEDRVNRDYEDGLAAGVQGTPHSIVLVGDKTFVISGAQPLDAVKKIIDLALEN